MARTRRTRRRKRRGSLVPRGSLLRPLTGSLRSLVEVSWGPLGSFRGALGVILEEVIKNRRELQLASPWGAPKVASWIPCLSQDSE
eukprot:976339-Pyramimonas_sp.AAC.1